MVWGAMSSAGVGPLCFLRSKVNPAAYQEVLEHFMLPAADQLYWGVGGGRCCQKIMIHCGLVKYKQISSW